MSAAFYRPLLLVLIIWTGAGHSALQPAGFTTWFWEDSIVVKNWLYIDGGAMYLSQNDGSIPQMQEYAQTFAIDLSIPWKNTTVSAVVTAKPSNFPFARRPTLWYDSTADLVYSIGGYPFTDAKINGSTIWAFQPDGNGGAPWQKNTSEGDLLWSQITPTFGALTASSDDSFYSLGGSIPPSSNDFAGTPSVAQSGMAVFEFQSNTWKNLSSSGYQASGFGVMGQAEYVRMFGKKGTIVFLGGDAPTGSFYSYATGSSLVDMSVVSIFDIDSGKWLTQQTTGNIPDRRYAFCMAGAAEKDAKSYELLVLGGLVGGEGNQRLSPSLTDVYLLSLPAFSWIKLNDSTTQMRASGKCKVIGNRQMLVIGGHDPSSSNFGTTPDSFANGLGIFDMSNLSWSDGYDPQAPEYLRPSLVNDYYAHNTQSPTWNSPQVQSLFETSAVATTPSTSPSTPPGRPKPRGHKAVGLIVGVVIGIVVAVSSLLLLGYWLTKRRRRRANPQIKPAPNPKYEVGTSPTHELEQPVGELESGFQPAVLQHHEMEAPQRIPR